MAFQTWRRKAWVVPPFMHHEPVRILRVLAAVAVVKKLVLL